MMVRRLAGLPRCYQAKGAMAMRGSGCVTAAVLAAGAVSLFAAPASANPPEGTVITPTGIGPLVLGNRRSPH